MRKIIWALLWFLAGVSSCVACLVTGHPFYAFLSLAAFSGLGHAALSP